MAKNYNRIGKLIISSESQQPDTPFDQLRQKTERSREVATLLATVGTNTEIRPVEIDGSKFADYFWQRLFAKGLAPDEMDLLKDARFETIRPSWLSLHSMGATRRYPRMDTSGHDIFIAHTPWPTRVSPNTHLLIRYHDAIPIFHPHQIKRPAMHQFHHYTALKSNASRGIFVCVSEATRRDLLQVQPEVESRTTVIPTSVSADFYPGHDDEGAATDIVHSYMSGGRSPLAGGGDSEMRYLLMVATIEPRKNHIRLIEAWEKLRRQDPDLKLVVVGSVGWNQGSVMSRMKKWKQRGDIYHLGGVPTEDLRVLYSNALAVVCPSVVEGFDMSGIEAMLSGSPVVASDIAVHRENYSIAALYFNPYSTEELLEVLDSLLYRDNPANRRDALVKAGLAQAKQFKRHELADKWATLFDEIMAGKYGRVGS